MKCGDTHHPLAAGAANLPARATCLRVGGASIGPRLAFAGGSGGGEGSQDGNDDSSDLHVDLGGFC